MMRADVIVFLLSFVTLVPADAAAQVELMIGGGRVSLLARNATVGQILEEWSRIGETHIENGDRVPGGPVTLQLDDVSEREALDTLLRSAAGYLAVAKRAPTPMVSLFDRILILPTSTVSATPNPPAPPESAEPEPDRVPPPLFPNEVQPIIGPDGQPVPDDQQNVPGIPSERAPGSMPQGISPPEDQVPVPPETPGTPGAKPDDPSAPAAPVGAPVPGMPVPPPPTRSGTAQPR
jgi:hypothetical protein